MFKYFKKCNFHTDSKDLKLHNFKKYMKTVDSYFLGEKYDSFGDNAQYKYTFGDRTQYKYPFYEITGGNKKCFLFGSVHVNPIHSVPQDIRNIMLSCSDLIVENYSDENNFDIEKIITNYNFYNCNTTNMLLMLNCLNKTKIKPVKLIKNNLLFNSKSTFFSNDFLDQLDKTKFFNEILKISSYDVKTHVLILTYIQSMYEFGIDSMVINNYILNNKNIFTLDKYKKEVTDNNNSDINPYYCVDFEKFMLLFITSKINAEFLIVATIYKIVYGKNWIHRFDLLFNDRKYNITRQKKTYIVHGRNNLWLPRIDEYINNLDCPLIVCGAAHVPDLIDNMSSKYKIKEIKSTFEQRDIFK